MVKVGNYHMKYFIRKIIPIVLIFVAIFLAGYLYYIRYYNHSSKMPQYTNTKVNSILTSSSVSPNGKLIFETLYKGTGDIIKEEQTIGASIAGKSEDEISKIYRGWSIKKFDSEEVIFYKEEDGFPPGYYIISSLNGYVSLYKSDGNGGKTLVEKTDILVNNLNPNDKERILNNIVVKDADEAYSILANLSS
ncbi:hypothetical protein [Thermoanaerobacterium thermosulfurigenes]|uniref:hypothetical protein n=1 Tax=Thermoanaerobacterium thermosulfurigenes TaxID=33950 RepID=UPI003F4A132B